MENRKNKMFIHTRCTAIKIATLMAAHFPSPKRSINSTIKALQNAFNCHHRHTACELHQQQYQKTFFIRIYSSETFSFICYRKAQRDVELITF